MTSSMLIAVVQFWVELLLLGSGFKVEHCFNLGEGTSDSEQFQC